MDYKTSGVDVEAGRAFVNRIKASVEASSRQEVIGGIGGFGGFFRIPKGFDSPVLVSGTDGVGTKLELAQDYKAHFEVGIDLVAMCVNDVITSGAQPLFFLDYIATGKLSPKDLSEVIEGISFGCQSCECALLGGETAEMPGFYKDGRYDLAGFCVGVVEESKIIDGSSIKTDDQIIGISSSGIHSNGFSLIRKVLEITGANQDSCFGADQLPLMDTLLKPTALYFQLVRDLINSQIPIKAMAHITGGGLPENLPRCLPNGVDASIDISSWEIPELFKWFSEKGNIPSNDLWNTFNLGIGFCVIVSPEELPRVLDICADNKFSAWNIGHIKESNSSGEPGLIGLPI